MKKEQLLAAREDKPEAVHRFCLISKRPLALSYQSQGTCKLF
jgi:hypothetical protein